MEKLIIEIDMINYQINLYEEDEDLVLEIYDMWNGQFIYEGFADIKSETLTQLVKKIIKDYQEN